MNKKIFTFKIGGEAGQGQQVVGNIFARACARGGFYTFNYSEYPSLVRGGHVDHEVSISDKPLFAAWERIDLLIALTADTIEINRKNLNPGAVILYDKDKFQLKKVGNFKLYPLPLETLSKEAGVKSLAQNMIALGATCALLNYNLEALNGVIKDLFGDKGKETVEMNIKAAKYGFDYANKNFEPEKFSHKLNFKKLNKNKALITANDGLSLGAIAGGCNFFISYPMTPASSILHNLAKWGSSAGIIIKQPEDEISGIHMIIGASWTGARAMTATSGGGFALMNEGFSMAGITETPIVVVMSQRTGPATGLPTWTEQGDLGYIAHAGHGEFLRVLIAPGDAKEAFYLTPYALNMAEKYQISVVILLDKYLSEAIMSVENIDPSQIIIERGLIMDEKKLTKGDIFKRYKITPSGVSPRTLPGQDGGVHLVNSDEHNEYGYTIEGYDSEMRVGQVKKRASKLSAILRELPNYQWYGPAKAELTLIGWGSVKGPVMEALKIMENVNYLHIPAPFPLSEKKLREAMKRIKKFAVIENNQTGQFANIIQEQTAIRVDNRINKYNGRQFWPEEVARQAEKYLN